jgi:PAS domain S-box-containing protein
MSNIERNAEAPTMKTAIVLTNDEVFGLIVSSIQDYAVFMLSPTGHIMTWNEGAQTLSGYTSREIIGQHFSRFYPISDIAAGKPQTELEIAMRRGRIEDLGWRVRKDGTVFWAFVVITAVHAADGKLTGFVKITRDLTEQLAWDEALRRSTERERLILEKTYNAYVAIDSTGTIVEWNPRALDLFGWRRHEAIGRKLPDLVVPERYREAHKRGLEHYVQTGETNFLNRKIEATALHRDGHEFPVELAAFPLETGENCSFGAFILDITERRKAEEETKALAQELRRSNEELQQFAYVAAHDLREPLRTIVSYTNLLVEKFKGKLDADDEENVAFIVGAAKRMQALISDLLAYSRVQTRQRAFQPTDCSAVMETVIASLKTDVEEAGGRVTWDPLPEVDGDASQLSQLFSNLVANAIKFRGSNPPIVHVGAQRQDDEWLFSVSDNGIGIEMQFAERIFLMFQRLHSMTEYPGTGMGLAICKKIVERHGGRIWIKSAPGEGSTFHFTFPVRQTAEGAEK